MSETKVTDATPAASDAREVVRAYLTELEEGRFDAALRHSRRRFSNRDELSRGTFAQALP